MPSACAAILAAMVMTGVLATAGCDRGGDQPASGRVVTVAAAADLKFALEEAVAAFKKLHPKIDVAPTYGSSGNFHSQLFNRAPFDIYFSADIEYPQKLAAAGLALPDSLFKYALGRIVVWVRKDSPIDVGRLGIESLAHPSVRKIAIANPEHAPYGRAADAAIRKLGILDRVKDRLVLGENIAQTAQFVESGAADVGIIALSLAMAPALEAKGKYWLIPAEAHPPLQQGGIIMAWAKDVEAARTFKAFVTGADGRAILRRYGFVLPGE